MTVDGDRIELTGIRGFGFHGVFAEERNNGQEFLVDLVIYCDLRQAGRTDELASTINYGELAVNVHRLIEGDPVDLIETLAERIANQVLTHKLAERVSVTVHKPSAPITVPFQDVSVTIMRERR